jgi:NAD(P)-dependent dehydrogenase (short-subunit alcohol dehydrogenase family)
MTPDLSGRTALVTGSARRVGRELLLTLADHGADVVVHYHTSDVAAAATAEEARQSGVKATVVQGDITDPDAIDAMFSDAKAALSTVDILVNAVGDFDARHWAKLDYADWQRVVETNLYGTYLCSKRALEPMRTAGWGRIINFGFADADRMHSHPVNFPYFVAKTGVLMFTRMLAYDTQDDGITVNAISPFAVENTEAEVSEFPRRRAASFADVAAPALFFASEAADYVSGQNVAIDGGRLPEA